MDLPTVWFVAVAVAWTGYFVLDGFDLGVGVLLPLLGRDDLDRRVVINAIGPVWDANEVWMVTAVGAMFAAFPAWYAAVFSGFYIPLLLVLVALIGRVIGLEFRGKVDDPRWRARCDAAIVTGSAVPAFVWGLVFADMVHGVGLDAHGVVTSSLLELLNPYALLGGLATLALFTLHGALFLTLKTGGLVRRRAHKAARRVAPFATALVAGFVALTVVEHGTAWTYGAAAVVVLGLLAAATTAGKDREGWAFACTSVTVGALAVVIFGSLYPALLPSTTDPAFGLTVQNTVAGPYTLEVLSWMGAVALPFVLGYQAWSYWVFRRRVTRATVGAS
jgi:cytochrome d ubiquinol oxidase subunit II